MQLSLSMPITGKIESLANSQVDVFNSGVLGDGLVIFATGTELQAPFDGYYTQINDHNLHIETADGGQWLLHVGVGLEQLPIMPVEFFGIYNATKLEAGATLASVAWPDTKMEQLTDLFCEVALVNTNQSRLQLQFISLADHEVGDLLGNILTF